MRDQKNTIKKKEKKKGKEKKGQPVYLQDSQ